MSILQSICLNLASKYKQMTYQISVIHLCFAYIETGPPRHCITIYRKPFLSETQNISSPHSLCTFV